MKIKNSTLPAGRQELKIKKETKPNFAKASMGKPLVSIVMPVYNAQDYLAEAINSILAQTYQSFEFIIIDDASTDGSLEIINKYQKRYPKIIKVISVKKNLNRGGDHCANLGIECARGKYIARMDADDISLPSRLEKQVEFLEKNPKVFLLGSNAYVIDKKGKIIGDKLEPSSSKEIYKSYTRFHPIIHPSATYRRFVGNKKFSYKIRYDANNDYYTFFSLICQGSVFRNLEEKLIYYRIHEKNDTFVNMKGKFMNTLKIRFEMILHYGYKPNIKDVETSILQAALLLLLPEKATKNLYLVSKGIIKLKIPTISVRKFIPFSI